MSHIYIQEPATDGKVLLKTSLGDIDIELWSKECPKASRNFVQLCMEGYYDNVIFHRIVKGFIAQGGDPEGDGTGGQSIYGAPFKDEFHSRLRFSRRGLVAMANSGPHDNGTQFFFTLAATPELQNQNTLFGKVTGDTIYNMLKFEDIQVDHNDRPFYPPKILGAEILKNPFDDMIPRPKAKKVDKVKKSQDKGVKNFGLLSFGEEAEVDEIETITFVNKNAGKAKSMHDAVDDPQLSKAAVNIPKPDNDDDLEGDRIESREGTENVDLNSEKQKERIKEKLKSKQPNTVAETEVVKKGDDDSSDDSIDLNDLDGQKKQAREKLLDIRQQIHKLRKDYKDTKEKDKKSNDKDDAEKIATVEREKLERMKNNEYLEMFYKERENYAQNKSKLPKKGVEREALTMGLLKGFREKLESLKQKNNENTDDDNNLKRSKKVMDEDDEDDIESDNWLAHTLRCEENAPVLAKDASTKGDDWYDVTDPRNPINKRKRGEKSETGTKRRN